MTVLIIVTITSFGGGIITIIIIIIVMHHYCHHDKAVTFITFIITFFLPCHTNYSQEPNASIFSLQPRR